MALVLRIQHRHPSASTFTTPTTSSTVVVPTPSISLEGIDAIIATSLSVVLRALERVFASLSLNSLENVVAAEVALSTTTAATASAALLAATTSGCERIRGSIH